MYLQTIKNKDIFLKHFFIKSFLLALINLDDPIKIFIVL
ncbi:hypothetical protein B488_08560 [Liberibacter crescens BT-1]|uniref:Uncharacterized protein n=1 Tax=Liberibacter crescens (strain BT-1) TaxID=1215343 RepID=L0EVZ9_LIBCB|nr:hypothetical protein B488_08560 [Liberibacter crescens BT-1]